MDYVSPVAHQYKPIQTLDMIEALNTYILQHNQYVDTIQYCESFLSLCGDKELMGAKRVLSPLCFNVQYYFFQHSWIPSLLTGSLCRPCLLQGASSTSERVRTCCLLWLEKTSRPTSLWILFCATMLS